MHRFKHYIKPLTFTALIVMSMPTLADSNNNGSGMALLAYISKVVNASVNAVANLIYQFNPDLPKTMATNFGQVTASQTAGKTASALSLAQVKNDLTSQPDNNNLFKMASIPATDSLYVSSSVWSLSGKKGKPNLTAGDNNFNFNSFFSPIAYSDKDQTYADNYIKFLGNQGVTLSTLDTKQLTQKQRKTLQAKDDYLNYQVTLRSLIAQQSLAYGNLYHLLAERKIKKDLGKSAGVVNDKGKNVDDASPLQVEKYLSTRRTDSPDWYAKMSTASNTTLLREIAFELAEIEKQQFQNHLDNERLIATVSAMELQTTQNEVGSVQQDEQKVEGIIKGMTGQGGDSSSSNGD